MRAANILKENQLHEEEENYTQTSKHSQLLEENKVGRYRVLIWNRSLLLSAGHWVHCYCY